MATRHNDDERSVRVASRLAAIDAEAVLRGGTAAEQLSACQCLLANTEEAAAEAAQVAAAALARAMAELAALRCGAPIPDGGGEPEPELTVVVRPTSVWAGGEGGGATTLGGIQRGIGLVPNRRRRPRGENGGAGEPMASVVVRRVPGRGRCVFAAAPIKAGELIETAPGLRFPREMYDAMDLKSTPLGHYVFLEKASSQEVEGDLILGLGNSTPQAAYPFSLFPCRCSLHRVRLLMPRARQESPRSSTIPKSQI
jgi:hypothetical protein